MVNEKITVMIEQLQAEYQKGAALLQDTQARMYRIEGAITKLQELLQKIAAEPL